VLVTLANRADAASETVFNITGVFAQMTPDYDLTMVFQNVR